MHQLLITLIVGIFVLRPVVSQQPQTQTQPSQQIQQPTQTQANIPLMCYQQITAPSGFNNITFPTNQNSNQYQQPQSYVNTTLPSVTCSPTTTACFKFVCAAAANYTVKGCQDPAVSQFSCATLLSQCPGNQGQCFTCQGNNCNGASEMKVGHVVIVGFAILLAMSIFGFNQK